MPPVGDSVRCLHQNKIVLKNFWFNFINRENITLIIIISIIIYIADMKKIKLHDFCVIDDFWPISRIHTQFQW